MFRKHGHVTKYDGEFLIVIVFALNVVFLLPKFLLQPILRFNSVIIDDFSCSEAMKRFIEYLHYFTITMVPLIFQILFMAVVWRLSRIQTSSQHNVLEDATNDDVTESHEESRPVTGSSVPLAQTINHSGTSLLSINEDDFE